MTVKDSFKRGSIITNEPMLIKPELLGKELASTPRRGLAFLVDLFLWLVSAALIMTLIAVLVLYFEYPTVYSAFANKKKASDVSFKKELFRLFAKRRPEAIWPAFRQALESEDESEFEKLAHDYRLLIDLTYDGSQKSQIDYDSKKLTVRWDLFFGDSIFVFNFGIIFLLYFTLFTWFLKGRTPGKLLLGIRVVRLDGKPIRFWDAFGRAGGYSASVSTLGLGFLEAIWHPNRQSIHDRISSTVVVLNSKRKDKK